MVAGARFCDAVIGRPLETAHRQVAAWGRRDGVPSRDFERRAPKNLETTPLQDDQSGMRRTRPPAWRGGLGRIDTMLSVGRIRGPRFTISLKRSTQFLQLSTSWSADYPIFRANRTWSRHRRNDRIQVDVLGQRGDIGLCYNDRCYQKRNLSEPSFVTSEDDVCHEAQAALANGG